MRSWICIQPYTLHYIVLDYLKIEGKTTGMSHRSSSAVPQGSHLGPLMYILFSSDIINCIAGTEVQLLTYADDTKFFRRIDSEKDRDELQLVIARVEKWCVDNVLQINDAKTIHFSYTRNPEKKFHSIYFILINQFSKKLS